VARALLWLTVGLRLGYGVVGLLPAFAVARFQVGSAGVGGLFLAQGVGAVLGPFLGRAVDRDLPHRRLVVAGAAVATFGLGYLGLASAPSLAVGLPMAVLGHMGVGGAAVLAVNGLQVATSDALRGRVMALVFGLPAGLQGVSAILAAPLTDAAGLPWATRALGLFAIAYSGLWLPTTRSAAARIAGHGSPAWRRSLKRVRVPPQVGRRRHRNRRGPAGPAASCPRPGRR
jgi:MFS family permease